MTKNDSPEITIVNTVIDAIAEHRLAAGTKLAEQELSEMFSCNRANVRRALASLAAQHVVELRPNRGAFVSAPSPKEAQDVFQARRAIERTIARNAAGRATAEDIADLRRNIEDEAQARASGNQPAELRLSREFHLKFARIAGNEVLERFLSELTMRTTLIIGLYAKGDASSCSDDDHEKLVEALEKGDPDLLVLLMDEHLKHLEATVSFSNPKPSAFSLRNRILPIDANIN